MGTNVEDLSAGGHIDLPPGFRFHPTDEEVITSYLMEKVIDSCFSPIAIGEVDLNRCEPWDLPSKAKNSGEKEWYFYCQKDRKYPTGTRTNRATESGYWKATGKDKEIYRGKGNLVGMKKTLVFYKGRAPRGEKTNWVMHEFRMEGKSFFNKAEMNEWVVCRVSCKNTEPIKEYDQNIRASSPSSSSSMAANCFDNDLLFDTQTIPPLVEINPSHNSFNKSNPNSITKNNSSFTSCTDHIKVSSSTTIPIQNQNQFQYSSENFISADPGLFQLKSPINGRNSYSSETTPQSFSYFYPQLFIPETRFIPTPTTMKSSLQLPHDRTINIEGLTDSNRIAQMRSHGTSSIQGGEGGEGLVSWRCKEEQYSNQSLVTTTPAVINDRSTGISSAFPVPEPDRTESFDDINQLLSSVGSLSDMESIWNY